MRLGAIACGLILALCSGGAATAEEPTSFGRFAADYLEAYFDAYPGRATRLGIHSGDARLRDLSRDGIENRVRELKDWLDRLSRLDRGALDASPAFDYQILDHAIRAELLELEEIRGWQRNPMLYNRVISGGVASLVDREFAPLAVRLEDLIDRMGELSRVIGAAKKNLDGVPALWVELAVRDTRGTVSFLRDDATAALAAQGLSELDPAVIRRWERTHRRTVRRLEKFVEWLDEDLRPRSHGNFRLGRDLFERKLLYEEHVDLDVETLVEMNEQAIEDYRGWVAREAARIDTGLSPAEVVGEVAGDYPSAAELIPTARRYVDQAREFVVDNEIVTLPTDRLPVIRPSPDYARSGFASMSTPGPFETEATEAYYNITNVDPSWTDEQQAEHLTYFNHPGLLGVSVHEVMPGHFVQLLYQSKVPTDLRKVFAPASLVEGWAHYTEQMMVDEGLGRGDPAIRLGQLRRALQRHARWFAGIELHTGDATVERAAERFAEIAYFAPFPALRETRRATYNPTYLYYALGRMQIFELREDYRRHVESRGEAFSLREFHDRFLSLGLPIPLARQALIPAEAEGRTQPRASD